MLINWWFLTWRASITFITRSSVPCPASQQGVDDFIARVEIALAGFGFTSENSIGEAGDELGTLRPT
jgi:hypothetical protein